VRAADATAVGRLLPGREAAGEIGVVGDRRGASVGVGVEAEAPQAT
jgi:hypothetical protein